MDVLKIYSVRLESELVSRIDKKAYDSSYCSRSDVLRLAIWIGEKVIDSRHLHELLKLKWKEESKGTSVKLEDVLRAADVMLENPKKVE